MNAYNMEQLISFFGNRRKIAQALKISPQAIYQWKTIPKLRAMEIERLTDGKFSANRASNHE